MNTKGEGMNIVLIAILACTISSLFVHYDTAEINVQVKNERTNCYQLRQSNTGTYIYNITHIHIVSID